MTFFHIVVLPSGVRHSALQCVECLLFETKLLVCRHTCGNSSWIFCVVIHEDFWNHMNNWYWSKISRTRIYFFFGNRSDSSTSHFWKQKFDSMRFVEHMWETVQYDLISLAVTLSTSVVLLDGIYQPALILMSNLKNLKCKITGIIYIHNSIHTLYKHYMQKLFEYSMTEPDGWRKTLSPPYRDPDLWIDHMHLLLLL